LRQAGQLSDLLRAQSCRSKVLDKCFRVHNLLSAFRKKKSSQRKKDFRRYRQAVTHHQTDTDLPVVFAGQRLLENFLRNSFDF
jgi:hypothetical protein